jgi:ABC-2 type transport system ATP-binding protein
VLLFDGADRQELSAVGEIRTPSIADLFVAVVGKETEEVRGEDRR